MAALSKKQQKAAAFRAKHKAKVEAIPDVPEADVVEDAEVEEEAVAPEPEGKRKRKRDDADADEDDDKAEKKDKKKGKKDEKKDDGEKKEDQPKAKRTKESKQRFILFIGNLGFKTTREDVAAHFAKDLGRTPSVRLLTERATGKQPPKSRGIAFLELASSEELQACLKQHHTQLQGRRINVELTAGGGGKSDARKTKLAERNKRIGDQREKRAEREKEAGGETEEKEEDKIGQGRQGWGAEPEVAGPDGVKMRGGRRVKKKGPDDNKSVSGWAARQASGASAPRGGFRKKWEPTGANAVSVG